MEDYENVVSLLGFDRHYSEHAFSISIGEKINLTPTQAAQLIRAQHDRDIVQVAVMDNRTVRIEHRHYAEDRALNAVWEALRLYVRTSSYEPVAIFEEPMTDTLKQALAVIMRELPDYEVVIRPRTSPV